MSTGGTARGAVGLAFLLAAFLGFAAGPCAAQTPAAPADWRTAVRKFAAEHFKQPAWGYSHSVRDYALARSLTCAANRTILPRYSFAASSRVDVDLQTQYLVVDCGVRHMCWA